MVIDTLNARNGTTDMPIDSYDNKMIDEIIVEGQSFHFAKQKDLTGTSEIVADNGVAEPIISLGVSGNTSQKSYGGYNPFKFKDYTTSKTDSDGNVITLEMKDGIATINGISNVFTTLSIDYRYEMTDVVFKAGTYTYTPYYYREQGQRISGCDWTLSGYAYSGTTGLATKTFENDFSFGACHMYLGANIEYKDYKFAPAIFEGTYTSLDQLPPYEPYVGGIPSPNPQYPQEIENANNSILPEGYQQVEYIESTGTQYIDTGFKPNQDTKVEIYGQQVSYNYNSLFGVNPLFVVTSSGGKYAFRYNNTTFATSVSSLGIAKLVLDKNNAYINDVLVNTFSAGTFQATYNACLFARANAGGGIEEKGSSKIYYAKIWDNGTLIRDFIPCYRKSDNEIGMYDLVNNVFYTNQGTGEFLKGANEGMSITLHGDNFREEIAIPTSVEVDGATVDLRFAKQGDKADKLIVDKISGKVTYEQWVKTEPLPIESATWGVTTTANQVNTLRVSTYLYNSISNFRISEGLLINKFKEIFDLTLDEQSFYLATGGLRGWIGIRVNRDLLETQDSAGVKKWLQTQQDEGDPVLIHYALTNPITRDITNTDLGQSLLALATGKGTNYLEITSHLEPSQTEFSYWRQIIPNE